MGDGTPSIEETLLKYKELGNNFDFACCIYSCAPLIQIASLKEAFTVLKKNVLDTVFPVVPFSFPIQRALKLKEEKLSFFNPEFALTRSQDLEVSYHDAGQFYFMNCESVLKKKALLTDKTGAVVLDELLVQDIDIKSDWKLAEFKYKLKNKKL